MEAVKRLIGSKSPAMYFQELCTKAGCTPESKERDLKETPSDSPKFEVTLFVTNFEGRPYEGVGVARNKKEAKQEAALNILCKMLTPQDIVESGMSSQSTPMATTSSSSSSSPIHTGVPTNDVSATACQDVVDLCAKKGLPSPEYAELGFEGPPHQRVYTCECRIKRGEGNDDLVVIAKAGKKNQAKRVAASQMVDKVRDSVSIPFPTSVDGLLPTIQSSIGENVSLCDNRAKCHELFAHDHHRFHSFQGDAIRSLHEKEKNFEEETDYEEIMSQVAKEEDFQVEYDTLPGFNHCGHVQCVCQMMFKVNRFSPPPAILFGSGSNDKIAKNNAAYQGLQFLKGVTKVSAPVG